MEARVEYAGRVERPRLTVVTDRAATYSALPHSIMRDTSLSRDARLLYAILQGHWWQGAESYASHAVMAEEMGCSLSGIRRYLDELIEAKLIAESLAGSRRAKVYTRLPIRQNDGIETVVNTSQTTYCGASNTSKPEIQYVKNDDSNTSKTGYSYKKTPVKKTLEEKGVPELSVSGVVVGADRATTKTTTDQAEVLASLSAGAREVVDWHRQCHGKKRPAKLNPAQVSQLEEAVVDLGVARLRESVAYMAGLGAPEIVKAIRAARTKRQRDEDDGLPVAPSTPHVNGTASKLIPATDDDRAVWREAVERLGASLNRNNVEAYLAPLEVAGRGEDGGLWLVVNPATAEHTAKFKPHISRALEDAGDCNPTAVRFKARRPKGQTDAE